MHLNHKSKILIQGMLNPLAQYSMAQMKAYGTQIVAGVSVGEGGRQWQDIPLFDLVEEAIALVGTVDATLIFVSPLDVLDAALEAIAAGISQLIILSNYIPPSDMVKLLFLARSTQTFILGPGSAGLIIPEQILLGSLEPQFYTPGKVGLISRSNSLTNEIAYHLTQSGLGQSLVVNLGDESILGSSFEEWLPILEEDKTTDAIVLVGQPQGSQEQAALNYITQTLKKPIIAYLAGRNTPAEKPLGDAAAIVATQLSGILPDTHTASEKIAVFEKAKVPVAKTPSQIPELVQKALKKRS